MDFGFLGIGIGGTAKQFIAGSLHGMFQFSILTPTANSRQLHNLALCEAQTKAGELWKNRLEVEPVQRVCCDWSEAATTGVLEPGRRQQNVFIRHRYTPAPATE